MQILVEGASIEAHEIAVRSMGFGGSTEDKPTAEFSCEISAEEFWVAIGSDIDDLIKESIEESEQGILEAEHSWIVSEFSGASPADELKNNPQFILRLVAEFMAPQFLTAVLDTGGERTGFKYVVNRLDFLRAEEDCIKFGGQVFLSNASS